MTTNIPQTTDGDGTTSKKDVALKPSRSSTVLMALMALVIIGVFVRVEVMHTRLVNVENQQFLYLQECKPDVTRGMWLS